MSYPMVHLSVAWRLLEEGLSVRRREDFLLGAVAPDAVHYRPGAYTSDWKLYSHYGCADLEHIPEKWGYVTRNEPWMAYIRRLWRSCDPSMPQSGFLLGYYTHILTDICNNTEVWTPFRMAQGGTFDRETYDLYGNECRNVDYVLYTRHPDARGLLEALERADAYTLSSRIRAEEVAALRFSLLHERFEPRPMPDVSGNRYFRLEDTEAFIRRAAELVRETATPPEGAACRR